MKAALRSMGWRYVLVLVVLTVGAMISIIVSDWYTAVACGVAVLIIAAVIRHRLRRPPEPSIDVTWENSVDQSRPQRPALTDIDHDRPLMSLATRGDNKGDYVNVLWDEDNKTWDLIVPSDLSPRWRWISSPKPAQGRYALTDDEYKVWARRWGLQFLPQNAYSDMAWQRNFR
jgi:hypothetical protein